MVAGALLLTQAFGLAAAQSNPASHEARAVWLHEETEGIGHVTALAGGNLMIATGDRVAALNGENGKVLWSREDFRHCNRFRVPPNAEPRFEFFCNYSDGVELGLVSLGTVTQILVGHEPEDGRLVVFDSSTGKTTYDSATRPLGKVKQYWYVEPLQQLVLWVEGRDNHYLFASVQVNTGELVWQFEAPVVKDLAWLGRLDDGAVLVYGKRRDDKRVVSEINLRAGKVSWEASGDLSDDVDDGPTWIGQGTKWIRKRYRFAPLVLDSASSLILFINKDGPIRMSRDGRVLWRAKDLAGDHPSRMHYANGFVYLARGKNVVAIDARSGRMAWRHDRKADITAIEPHERGVLVWSERDLELLSPDTGRPVWSQKAALPLGWGIEWAPYELMFRPMYFDSKAPRLVVGDVAYVAGYQDLISIDLQSGGVKPLAAYELPDHQPVLSLDMVGEELVVASRQAFMRLDRDGGVKVRRYYKTVGANGWARLAAIGVRSALSAVAEAADVVYNPFAGPAYEAFQYRSNAGGRDESCVFIFFQNESGDTRGRYGLTCVNRSTGDEQGTMWMNSNEPSLLFNARTRTVFWRDTGKSIRAVRFDPPPGK